MTAGALLLATLALFLAAAWGRPALTLASLAGTTLLVPSTLPVPHVSLELISVTRVVELGALIGVVVAARRGRLGPRPLRAHVVMIPLLAYLAVIVVTGLVTAEPGLNPKAGAYLWVSQAEQASFLLLALALGRGLRARTVLLTLSAVVALIDLIAVAEFVTQASWARQLFAATPAALGKVQAASLQHRGSQVRVRAAGDFALQTGWILAALLPVVVAAAVLCLRTGRRVLAALLLAVAAATAVAVGLTQSRTPLIAVAVLLAVLVLALAYRRPATLVAGVLLLAGAVLAVGPTVLSRVAPSVDQGSIDVRLDRLPQVLALPAAHPLTGVGLSGVQSIDLQGLDTSYVLTYVETGAIAAALLLVLLAFALGSLGRGLLPATAPTARSGDRFLVLAAFLGGAALAVSATTMDTFQAQASNRLTWLLVGLGLAAAERRRGPQRLPQLRIAFGPARLGAALAALVVGVGIAVLAPTHAATQVVFATVDPAADAAGVAPGSYGRTYVVTACQLAQQLSLEQSWQLSSCGESGPPGWGSLRLQGPNADTVNDAIATIFRGVHGLPTLKAIRYSPAAGGPTTGTPTAARVAPYVLPIVVLVLGLLLPGRVRDWTDPDEPPIVGRDPVGTRASSPF